MIELGDPVEPFAADMRQAAGTRRGAAAAAVIERSAHL